LYALFADGLLASLMILLIDTKKDGENNNIRQFYKIKSLNNEPYNFTLQSKNRKKTI
jgi:hypothetical protein